MAMEGTKSAAKSLTIQAGVIGTVASVLAALGIHIAPDAVPQLEAIITGIAAAVAIYGRIRAKTLIA